MILCSRAVTAARAPMLKASSPRSCLRSISPASSIPDSDGELPASRYLHADLRQSGVTPISTVEEGAEATLNLNGRPGQFYNGLRPSKASPQAYDETVRERLRVLTNPGNLPSTLVSPASLAMSAPDSRHGTASRGGSGPRRTGGSRRAAIRRGADRCLALPDAIRTVRGVSYMFVPPIRSVASGFVPATTARP
jgi:hypothetical protein